MVVSVKDSVKLVGISIICFCAVLVCTFFVNYYVDALAVKDSIPAAALQGYNGQLATAQLSCGLSGGCLSLIAVVMLVFYIKLYVDGHVRELGVLKAMGYSNAKIASRFWMFGLSVFIGAALGLGAGYAIMPVIYEQMTMPEFTVAITINFHAWLPVALVVAPTVVFSLLSCGLAYLVVRRPVGSLLRGETEKRKISKKPQKQPQKEGKDRPFLKEMCLKTLSSKKSLAFFAAFSSFCFAAMVQMGAAMESLSTETMGLMILLIGVVLAFTTLIIAITALINGNKKNIAVMKAFGYNMKECALSVFVGYIPFVILGFGIGTAYQYGLLQMMVSLFFSEYELVYGFDVGIFFIVFAVFAVLYTAITALYTYKLSKVSVKEIMLEN